VKENIFNTLGNIKIIFSLELKTLGAINWKKKEGNMINKIYGDGLHGSPL